MNKIDKEKNEILSLVEEVLEDNGAHLAELVVSKYQHNTTVKFFLYLEGSTTMGDYAKISRSIYDLLEESNMYESGFGLEVSSPGLDRKLINEIDFRFRSGEKVKIVFKDSKRKKITADIIATENGVVEFENSDGKFKIDLTDIDNAKIVF